MNRLPTRFAAAGVASLLLLSFPGAAVAQAAAPPAVARPPALTPAISEEEALALVQRYFKLPDGPGRLEASLETDGSRPVWQLTYWIDHANGSMGHGVGVVDAITGQIRQFRLDERARRPQTGPLGEPYSEEEARERAWSLVEEIFPEAASSLRPAPQASDPFGSYFENDTYAFAWMEHHNDVPVLSSGVRVEVDRYTLDYVSVIAGLLENPVYPEGSATVSPEEALAKFREAAVPSLRYQLVYPEYPYSVEAEPEVRLVYQVTTPSFVDAVTGRFVDYAGEEPIDLPPAEAVPAGSEPHRAVSLPLTPAAAIAVGRELLGLPEEAVVRISDPVDDPDEEVLYSLHWFDEQGSASVALNRKTGLVEYAFRSISAPGDASAPGLAEPAEEQKVRAREEAIRVVQRHFSELLPSLKLEPVGQPSPFPGEEISFRFQRYEHGIPFAYDGVEVVVDPATGQWTRISASWQEGVELEPPEEVMSPEAAVEAYFAGRSAQLVYQQRAEAGVVGPWIQAEPVELMLVYQHVTEDPAAAYGLYGLDAVTGEPVSALSPAFSQEAVDQLLRGHWAEGELRYMLRGLWLSPSDLDPEGEMSRAAALRLLLSTAREVGRYASGRNTAVPYVDVSRSDGNLEQLRAAIALGVLRPEGESPRFDGDAPITRAEFALWIARLLGLGDLARSSLRTVSGFTDLDDLSAEQRNAVAFLEALALISPAAAFRGEDALTQAEAAAMAVRLLLHLQKAQ